MANKSTDEMMFEAKVDEIEDSLKLLVKDADIKNKPLKDLDNVLNEVLPELKIHEVNKELVLSIEKADELDDLL
jgi:hypothetical protein